MHPICVTGMGRSGTSLTTALIGLLGVYLGPEERMLAPAEHDNARGYWEQREIYEINEEVLGAFGGTWESPPDLLSGWQESPDLDVPRERARLLLAEMFYSAGKRWAWKDPRASLTMPFWQALIGEMDYVICVRNPADVARSIAARESHDLDFDGSLEIWRRYMKAAIDNTRGSRRLIVNYEDYFSDPDRQICRLAEFICGPGVPPPDDAYERIERFIEPGLWHNRDDGDGLDRVRAVSPDTAYLYMRLSVSLPQAPPRTAPVPSDRSLLAGLPTAWVSWFALLVSSIVAMIDAIDDHIVLIPLLAAGPLCAMLTGLWKKTAAASVWVTTLALLLCLPDEIWGTSTQLVYIGLVVAVALMSTTTAAAFQRRYRNISTSR